MSDGPNAGVLIVGAEVLSGKVQDENGPFLIRRLRELGVALGEIRVIEDDVKTIQSAVVQLRLRFDWVITTGGIGPTHDDLTIDGVAAAIGVEVVEDPDLIRRLAERYGKEPTGAQRRLSRIPAGAQLTFSESGWPVIQAANVFVFPGVPKLMRRGFDSIGKTLGGRPFHTVALELACSETRVADLLADVQNRVPEVSIGSYPQFDGGPVKVRVTFDSRNRDSLENAVSAVRAGLSPADLLTG